jgi:hypothetical protein
VGSRKKTSVLSHRPHSVEDYILNLPIADQEAAFYIHNELLSQPGMRCDLRWSLPFYGRKRWICYLNPLKKGGFEWVFLDGQQLYSSGGLLQKRSRSRVAGLYYPTETGTELNFIPENLVQEALWLDDLKK